MRIATTRKAVPGARRLSQLAVEDGGGILHRHGLAETILVFRQYRAFLPGRALADIAALLRAAEPEKALAVEVDGVEEAVETAEAGFDVIQLENSPPRRSPRSPPG